MGKSGSVTDSKAAAEEGHEEGSGWPVAAWRRGPTPIRWERHTDRPPGAVLSCV